MNYVTAKDAERAINTLNGLRLQSKTIKVGCTDWFWSAMKLLFLLFIVALLGLEAEQCRELFSLSGLQPQIPLPSLPIVTALGWITPNCCQALELRHISHTLISV